MDEKEIQLALLLLQYLRSNAQVGSVHKFNAIGRSGKGEFELWAGLELTKLEKESLIWLWDELKRLRLIAATGQDLIDPDGWVMLSERGAAVTESELQEMFAIAGKRSEFERRLDPLLGILDRGEFDKDLVKLCKDVTSGKPLALVMVDFDHFKTINDRFGHPTGDGVLRQTASVIREVVNGKGDAYRYGGEELAILLRNHSMAEAVAVAERLRLAIESLDASGIDSDVTASFGVASYPETTDNARDLLEMADAALYQSKGRGRNCVTCAERSANNKVPMRKTRAAVAPVALKLNLRVQLESGSRESYLINVENYTDSKLLVQQISIEQDGIALMEAVRAKKDDNWTVEPQLRRHISWRAQPNPADSLVRLHSTEGIQFNSTIELVLTISSDGAVYEHRQKLAVRVFVSSGEVKQLVG